MIEQKCINPSCGKVFLKLPTAKSVLCCDCRALRRRRLTIRRNPVDRRAIKSVAELEQYFVHDELECLICGHRCKGLFQHLTRAHGITARDYKKQFGIPTTYGLVGKATREKMKQCGLNSCQKTSTKGYQNLANARAARGGERVRWPDYMAQEQAIKMHESPNHPCKKEGTETLVCKQCAKTFEMDAKIALAFQCRSICQDCKKANK